jgi:hypothetical protein
MKFRQHVISPTHFANMTFRLIGLGLALYGTLEVKVTCYLKCYHYVNMIHMFHVALVLPVLQDLYNSLLAQP